MPRPSPPCPDDGAPRLKAELRRALGAAGLALGPADRWTSLPGGRSNHVWKAMPERPDRGGAIVVKLYPHGDANPLFRNDPGSEAAVLEHLAGTGLAPRLLARAECASGPILAYRHVPGRRWTADPRPVARALARLHRLAPPAGLPWAPEGADGLRAQARAILSLCPPALRAQIGALEPRTGPIPGGPPPRPALLHGDCVAGNILTGPAGACLIDWQCPAIGDPALDIAVFLSPAMHRLYRGHPLSREEAAMFLASYGDPAAGRRYRALAPLFHWRMAAYCAWRLAQGDSDYAEGLRLECAELGAGAMR